MNNQNRTQKKAWVEPTITVMLLARNAEAGKATENLIEDNSADCGPAS